MPDASQRGRLVITVTDTGPGIASDELSKIFTSRFRGAQQADQQIEGSGLGLSIVKRLVDAMQGSIAVNSVVGQGSMFTLTLPLDLARPVERREPDAVPNLLVGRRVLLVDDDPTMLLAGSKALQRAGAQVRLANTAEDALAACQDVSPDAFVLDLNIPGVDVVELVRAIRRMPELKARPIIAFSAKMDAQRAAKCRALGFDAAIQKDADLPLAVADVLLAA
jgi:CheY-like chemotaxis protein